MHNHRFLSIGLCAVLLGTLLQPAPTTYLTSASQVDAQYFPQTGKTLTGRFLDYWKSHGGLPQQGYPISDMFSERSEVDGKIYTVQYFERAVFESHPENPAPHDVLLTLLGSILYKQKYPNGAPEQVANPQPSSRLFAETGKRVGEPFLTYWQTHGALAQQGYPISEEFLETSPLDGKQYKVQYFERAVFEYHPENTGTQYEVLLSQLGTFRWQSKQTTASSTATPQAASTAVGSVSPSPTSVPTTDDCSNVPSVPNFEVRPKCGPYGTRFQFTVRGFRPGERIDAYSTRPDGTHGSPLVSSADSNGNATQFEIHVLSPRPGIWAITFKGGDSQTEVTGYFGVTGPNNSTCRDGPPPPGRNASVTPGCGIAGSIQFDLAAFGFKPGEAVGVYYTMPNQEVYPFRDQGVADSEGYLVGGWIRPGIQAPQGIWAVTFEGVESHVTAVGYFKLYKP